MWFWLFVGASNALCDVQRPPSQGRGRITEKASRDTKFSLDACIIMDADARQAEMYMFAIMSMFNRMSDWRKSAVTSGELNACYTFTMLLMTRYFSVPGHLDCCALNVVVIMCCFTMYMYRCGSRVLTRLVGCENLDAECRSSWNGEVLTVRWFVCLPLHVHFVVSSCVEN